MPKAKQVIIDGDSDLARFVVETIKADTGVAPVYTAGQLYTYDGRLWKPLNSFELKALVQKFHRSRVGLRVSGHMTKSVAELLGVLCYSPGFFQAAKPGVNFGEDFVFASGMAQEAMRIEAVSPEHRCTYGYDFDYKAYRAPAAFLAFLREVWEPDVDAEQKIQHLGEFLGACILGTVTQYERSMFLYGPSGDNGKSVLIEVIERLFPDEHRRAIRPQEWGDQYYRFKLASGRINLVGELPRSEIADSEAFKAIISGNTITGRNLREEVMEFKPRCGHVFAANRLPIISNPDSAFWKRVNILEFNRKFSATTPRHQVLEPLFAEVPEIASWAVRLGCELYARGHYESLPSSDAAKQRWKMRADQVLSFLADCTRNHNNGKASGVGETYDAYKKYAMLSGHSKVSFPNFQERMFFHGFDSTRGGTGHVYRLEVLDKEEWKVCR